MNRRLAAVLLAVLTVFTFVPVASAQSAPTLSDIRTGRHAGFDRIVLDMSRHVGTDIRLQELPAVVNCGSGNQVVMPGNEKLLVTVIGAAAHDDNGNPTYTGSRNFPTPELANVRGVAFTCDFEATLGIAVGYANTASWHRVFTLTSPNRVVIDIGL